MKQAQDYCGVAAGIGTDLIKRFTDKPFEAGSFHDHTQPAILENQRMRDAPLGQTQVNSGQVVDTGYRGTESIRIRFQTDY